MSLENVKNIVLVLSGKGGVGKSSITTQLALSLCLAGHSVGILDVDLTGPSIPRLLGIEASKVKQAPGGWLPVEVHAAQVLPPCPITTLPVHSPVTTPPTASEVGISASKPAEKVNNGHPDSIDDASTMSRRVGSLQAMSLAFLLASRSSAIVWRGPKKTAMIRQFLSDVLWPPTDYLLIDTPPGTSDEHISLVETLLQQTTSTTRLAGAVIVTTPQAVAVADVRKELNFCAKTRVPILGVVENLSGYICECCGELTNLFSAGGGQAMAQDAGVAFLGRVPVDTQWGALVEEGHRPRYEPVAKRAGHLDDPGHDDANRKENDDDDDDDDKDSDDEEDEDGDEEEIYERRERDPGLLIDKYRNCSLCPVFESVARQVVQTIHDGTAVTLTGL